MLFVFRLIFDVNNHETSCRVDVPPDGLVTWHAGGHNHGWVSLAGITFETLTDADYLRNPSNVTKYGASWYLSKAGDSCQTTCTHHDLQYTDVRAPVSNPIMPLLLGRTPKRKQFAWGVQECFVAKDDRFHVANANGVGKAIKAQWKYSICQLACPCVKHGGLCDESQWPDKDHGLVCGDCKVLVDKLAVNYGGKCSNYCAALNMNCTGAWEEQDDTCRVKTTGSCDTSFGTTSDAICKCTPM